MGFRLQCIGLAVAILLAGCGYVGDPLPPALNIPVRITDLAAVERGDNIVIQFTVPGMTTEGTLLSRYGELELRIGGGLDPWHQPTWEAAAERIEAGAELAAGPMRVETPAASWTGREAVLAVRLSNHKGRWSEWSNLVALHVVEPLPAPAGLAADAVPAGVRLQWRQTGDRPNCRFRVYRRTPDSRTVSLIAEPDRREWTDTGTRFGITYEYIVQAVVPAGDKLAESELSSPISITPVDTFPPAVPTGLAAVAGLDTIELTWNRNQEPDLAFYRVYRSAGEGQRQKISDSLEAPSYSDRDVTSGTQYRYAVSSVDQLGNESDPSATVEQAAP
jgi:hypothetical protein